MKSFSGYDSPATGRQLHTIACLCQAKGISEPVEEQPMTVGEAGVLIRRLSNVPVVEKEKNMELLQMRRILSL